MMLGQTVRSKLPEEWIPARPARNWYRDPELKDSLEHCREVTRRVAKSFFFSSFPLPSQTRWAAFTIYGFCRYVDDYIDQADEEGRDLTAAEDVLILELQKIHEGTSTLPFARAFQRVLHEYAIPLPWCRDLIHGCCLDRGPVDVQTFAELELYCYYVASVVGLMMSKPFGLNSTMGAEHALEMGVAMQLTNILRDVDTDLKLDRIYLPAEERKQFGIERADLQAGNVTPAWRDFMRFQIDRARLYYEAGESGIRYLDPRGAQWCTAVMSRVYGGILGAIEQKQMDVFSDRVYVPTWRKIVLALKSRSLLVSE